MNRFASLLFASVPIPTMKAFPAAAADSISEKSEVVRYADLNLSSEAGARTLYRCWAPSTTTSHRQRDLACVASVLMLSLAAASCAA